MKSTHASNAAAIVARVDVNVPIEQLRREVLFYHNEVLQLTHEIETRRKDTMAYRRRATQLEAYRSIVAQLDAKILSVAAEGK